MQKSPQLIQKILRMHSDGYSMRRVAAELGIHLDTVRRYVNNPDFSPKPRDKHVNGILDKADQQALLELFKDALGNSSTITRFVCKHPEKYGLASGTTVTSRTVRRFFSTRYPALKKTVRSEPMPFHCEPGQQLQIDFVKAKFQFDGHDAPSTVYLFEAVFPWSRKSYVRVCPDMKQGSWFMAIIDCFDRYGIAREILCDNDRSLVIKHPDKDKPIFHPMFEWLCRPLKTKPRACRPARPQTKGCVERFGRFLQESGLPECRIRRAKNNAELQQMLETWIDEVADMRKFNDCVELGPEKTSKELFEYEKQYLAPSPGLRSLFDFAPEIRRVDRNATLALYGEQIQLPLGAANGTVVVSVKLNGNYIVVASATGEVLQEGSIAPDNLLKYGQTQVRPKPQSRAVEDAPDGSSPFDEYENAIDKCK